MNVWKYVGFNKNNVDLPESSRKDTKNPEDDLENNSQNSEQEQQDSQRAESEEKQTEEQNQQNSQSKESDEKQTDEQNQQNSQSTEPEEKQDDEQNQQNSQSKESEEKQADGQNQPKSQSTETEEKQTDEQNQQNSQSTETDEKQTDGQEQQNSQSTETDEKQNDEQNQQKSQSTESEEKQTEEQNQQNSQSKESDEKQNDEQNPQNSQSKESEEKQNDGQNQQNSQSTESEEKQNDEQNQQKSQSTESDDKQTGEQVQQDSQKAESEEKQADRQNQQNSQSTESDEKQNDGQGQQKGQSAESEEKQTEEHKQQGSQGAKPEEKHTDGQEQQNSQSLESYGSDSGEQTIQNNDFNSSLNKNMGTSMPMISSSEMNSSQIEKLQDKLDSSMIDENKSLNDKEESNDDKDLRSENDEDSQTDIDESSNGRKSKLRELRDRLLQYAEKKKEEEIQAKELEKSRLQKSDEEAVESEEEKYELSEHANQFLDSLKELPSFKDRDRGPGYGINTDGYTDVSDSVIRTLISKFLNRRFCRKSTDLNVRSNSLKKTRGFYKWNVNDVITHLETEQVTKALNDKYGYEYANGKNEAVPLSFYFDMSCSMSAYTNLLAVIAIELLKKGVKVLIGFNERVNVQIDSIKGNVDVAELAKMLELAGYSSYNASTSKSRLSKNGMFKFKFIGENLDNYLIRKKAEKCVVFADFDPISEVCNLSRNTEVYWFCFEEDFSKIDVDSFYGFIYKVQDEDDIARGLIKVNENKFEALCFTENPKEFVKRKE